MLLSLRVASCKLIANPTHRRMSPSSRRSSSNMTLAEEALSMALANDLPGLQVRVVYATPCAFRCSPS